MHPQFDVCPNRKIAYLILRKCGCSSFRQAIAQLRGDDASDLDQQKIHQGGDASCLQPSELSRQQDWFTFTFVRDPISRFLSFYATKIRNQNLTTNHTFVNHARFGLLPNMTIDQVLDVLSDQSIETEPHAAVQTEYLASVGFELDYIGRLEETAACIDEIYASSGLRLSLSRLNRAKQCHLLPTKNQFNRLADFYRNDIDAFGYPADYASWCRQFVDGKEQKFQTEAGYTFNRQAKLLQHDVSATAAGYRIDLRWRLHPQCNMSRTLRIGTLKNNLPDQKLFQAPKTDLTPEPHTIRSQANPNERIVSETILAPFQHFPRHFELKDIFIQLYFSDETQRAELSGNIGHDNLLLLPMGQISTTQPMRRAA